MFSAGDVGQKLALVVVSREQSWKIWAAVKRTELHGQSGDFGTLNLSVEHMLLNAVSIAKSKQNVLILTNRAAPIPSIIFIMLRVN